MAVANHVRNPLLPLAASEPANLDPADQFVEGPVGGGAHQDAQVVHVAGQVGQRSVVEAARAPGLVG